MGADGRMGEATEYEERISRALARIAQATERRRAVPAPDVPAADPVAPADARLGAEIDRLRRENAAREAERDAARARLADMDEALQSLRAVQATLGRTVAELRAALAGQVAEPALVNRAMQAEIEALTAQRRADVAEVDAVLDALVPLVDGEDSHAPG